MDEQASNGGPSSAAPAAPSVVAVVVCHQPGPWFEEALGSLVVQDYPNLSILVIDTASATDPTPRIAEIAPRAYVRRLGEDLGFAAAVNEAITMVEGAAFFVLLHDDVALAPNAVRLLVEEAFRSNAGVVGPKVTDWHDERQLLSVGLGADKFGVPAPVAERFELDQEQHDAVRDVFAVSSAAMLVRADLLRAVGGYDDDIFLHGEDVDLCWRAHLAGARVLVAPAARVRHVEALGERREDDRRRLQQRHRLRLVLTNYGLFYLVAVLPQQAVLSLLEAVTALLTGRLRHASDVGAAWLWNLRRLGSVVAKRRQVRRVRQVRDLEIRRLQVRGSARVTGYIRGSLGGDERAMSVAAAGRRWMENLRSGVGQEHLVVTLGLVALLVFGSRHLLTRPIPVLGELSAFPGSANDLLAGWWSGWRDGGLGVAAPAPTGLGFFGLASWVAAGATGLARTVLVLGLLPVGLVGAWRLGGLAPPSRARLAALLAFALIPVPYAALATGAWAALAVWAFTPWILGRLARALGGEPYDDETLGRTRPQSMFRQVLAAGALTALVGMWWGGAPALLVALTLALVVGSLLAGSLAGTLRMVGVGLGGSVVAVVLHLPWYLGALDGGVERMLAPRAATPVGAAVADVAAFDLGPIASSPLGWGFLVAASLAVLIGTRWRLAWAVRAWVVIIASLSLTWLAARGSVPFDLPSLHILLAPAAGATALATAMGMASIELDLRGYGFGRRQFATALALVAFGLASLPTVGAAFGGRWSVPAGGYDSTFSFMDDEAEADGSFRVLWIGDPQVLPLTSWELSEGLGYATSVAGSIDPELGVWATDAGDATPYVRDAFELAASGSTSHLGRLLAPMGVRYVVVVDQQAPVPYGGERVEVSPAVTPLLANQLDLRRQNVNPSVAVFESTAWAPLRAIVEPAPDGSTDVEGATSFEEAAHTDLSGSPAALVDEEGRTRFAGDLEAGTSLHVAEAFDDGWELVVDGEAQRRSESFGWANRYDVTAGGAAELRFDTDPARPAFLVGQLVLWLVVGAVLVREPGARKRRRRRRRPDAPVADVGVATLGPGDTIDVGSPGLAPAPWAAGPDAGGLPDDLRWADRDVVTNEDVTVDTETATEVVGPEDGEDGEDGEVVAPSEPPAAEPRVDADERPPAESTPGADGAAETEPAPDAAEPAHADARGAAADDEPGDAAGPDAARSGVEDGAPEAGDDPSAAADGSDPVARAGDDPSANGEQVHATIVAGELFGDDELTGIEDEGEDPFADADVITGDGAVGGTDGDADGSAPDGRDDTSADEVEPTEDREERR